MSGDTCLQLPNRFDPTIFSGTVFITVVHYHCMYILLQMITSVSEERKEQSTVSKDENLTLLYHQSVWMLLCYILTISKCCLCV